MFGTFSVVEDVSKVNAFGRSDRDNFGFCCGPVVRLRQRLGTAQHPLQ